MTVTRSEPDDRGAAYSLHVHPALWHRLVRYLESQGHTVAIALYSNDDRTYIAVPSPTTTAARRLARTSEDHP
jgi:hypothetical protein